MLLSNHNEKIFTILIKKCMDQCFSTVQTPVVQEATIYSWKTKQPAPSRTNVTAIPSNFVHLPRALASAGTF